MRKCEYNISYLDLGVEHRDVGCFRSYELNTQGDTREELIKEAAISEISKDGGELRTYGLDDCSPELEKAVLSAIDKAVTK